VGACAEAATCRIQAPGWRGAGHIPAHTWRLSSCLSAGHTLHTRDAWAPACGLGTPQHTRGAWAALGWGQMALGSWL